MLTRYRSSRRNIVAAVLLVGLSFTAAHAEIPPPLAARFSSADSITESKIPGLYAVRTGTQIQYVDRTGRYGFAFGDLTDFNTGESLTEDIRRDIRRDMLADVGRWDPIDFVPADARHTIIVFTDISCGWCQRLHSLRAEYNALGIGIRYLAFPRPGTDASVAETMLSVWCADDRQAAMDKAKSGQPVDSALCLAPVAAQTQLGRALGVNGTPALFTLDGDMFPGFIEPQQLLQELEGNPPAPVS